MFYSVLSILITALGLIAVFFSIRILLKKSWFFGWLRGMGGLLLIIIGVTLAMSALDVYSYKQIVAEESVATISFEKIKPQRYRATVAFSDGTVFKYEIAGDQWQMDVRLLKWPTALAAIGVKPGYRLDRISGRYYSLEQERNSERTIYSLNDSKAVDVWTMFNALGSSFNIVDADYGSATFVPMEDAAQYEVKLSNTGLLARPLNEAARSAIGQWE